MTKGETGAWETKEIPAMTSTGQKGWDRERGRVLNTSASYRDLRPPPPANAILITTWGGGVCRPAPNNKTAMKLNTTHRLNYPQY